MSQMTFKPAYNKTKETIKCVKHFQKYDNHTHSWILCENELWCPYFLYSVHWKPLE